jgi:hypothetical protein
MIAHEIVIWSRWAAQGSVNAVAQVAADAMAEWPMRMCGDQELDDLAPWRQSGWVALPARWHEAAALAAAEMAIICHIWPEPPDEVLRPARTIRRSR